MYQAHLSPSPVPWLTLERHGKALTTLALGSDGGERERIGEGDLLLLL